MNESPGSLGYRKGKVRVQVSLPLASLLLSSVLGGAACTAQPIATPAAGPSKFLAGFQLGQVVASVNATPNGPRCRNVPPVMPTSSFGDWSEAKLTTACEDPGDGTVLAQTWAAGVSSELNRLGASVLGRGESTTTSGVTFITDWEYSSNGVPGHVSIQVLPAPEGKQWLIFHISEPS